MESLKNLQNGTVGELTSSDSSLRSSMRSSSNASGNGHSVKIREDVNENDSHFQNSQSPYDPPPIAVTYNSRDFLSAYDSSKTSSKTRSFNGLRGSASGSQTSRSESPAFGQNDSHVDSNNNKLLSRQRSGNAFHVPNVYVQRNHLEQRYADNLYHLNMILEPADRSSLRHRFGDVKFVITGGTPSRMQSFARLCLDRLNISVPAGLTLCDLCGSHARYVMYKAGPVLAVNHGMGIPSLSIMLHEVFKLLHYAEASADVVFFRLGTCGGVGVPGGTVVVSNKIYDGLFRTNHQQLILGKRVIRPAILNAQLNDELAAFAGQQQYPFPVCSGATMCTDDFYEGQARLDGAICSYTNEEKLSFLRQCYDVGVRNIEMESLAFAAYTHYVGVKAAVVCIALLDRLHADQISADKAGLLSDWEERPRKLIVDYIASRVVRNGAARQSPTPQQNGSGISSVGGEQRRSTNDHVALEGDNLMYPNIRRSRSLTIVAMSPEAERVLAATVAPSERPSTRLY